MMIQVAGGWAKKKKGLLLFDYASHPCTGTMLIFSVYLSVCLMSQPEGWTIIWSKIAFINFIIWTNLNMGISIKQNIVGKRFDLGLDSQHRSAGFFFLHSHAQHTTHNPPTPPCSAIFPFITTMIAMR